MSTASISGSVIEDFCFSGKVEAEFLVPVAVTTDRSPAAAEATRVYFRTAYKGIRDSLRLL